jgi:hypothetical protein
MVGEELQGTAGVIVTGEMKGGTARYNLLTTCKEAKRESYKSAMWAECWKLELGTDESLAPQQLLQGRVTLTGQSNEESCAELSISRKWPEGKLNARNPTDMQEIVGKVLGIIKAEHAAVWQGWQHSKGAVAGLLESTLRRKVGKGGAEHHWEGPIMT